MRNIDNYSTAILHNTQRVYCLIKHEAVKYIVYKDAQRMRTKRAHNAYMRIKIVMKNDSLSEGVDTGVNDTKVFAALYILRNVDNS